VVVEDQDHQERQEEDNFIKVKEQDYVTAKKNEIPEAPEGPY